jgi:hypothetical protein
LALWDVTTSESGETELHNRAVVQDLRRDVGLLDRILQVRHEEQVSGLVEPTVRGVVEDVREDSSGSKQGGIRVVDVDAERVDEGAGILLRAGRRNLGLEIGDRLGDGGLKVVNDRVGLQSARAQTLE